MKRKRISDTALTSLAALTALLAASGVQAIPLTWDPGAGGVTGSDGAGTWLDPALWWDGAAAATWSNATPDTASIGSGGTGEWTIDLTGGVTVADATFDNYTGEYRLGSGALTVNGTLTWGPNTTSNGEGKDGVEFLNGSSIAGSGTIVVNGHYPAGKEEGQLNIKSSDNTAFDGTWDVRNGVLYTEGGRPSATSNIILNGNAGATNGAVYSSRWSQTLTRELGTADNQIQVIGNRSGFEGQGTSSLTVQLTDTGIGSQQVQWGSANFDPSVLLLQSPNANQNGNLVFDTAVDLNGAPRTVEVDVVAVNSGGANMSRQLSNSDVVNPSGLTKIGPGRLILSNTSNDYDGPTLVNEGILQLGTTHSNTQSIPGKITAPFTSGVGSNLVVDNSMIAFYFTFNRAIGTGIHDVQFTGASAGLTQRQGDRPTFVFGDSSTEVVWGAAGFDPAEFVINSDQAGAATTLRWQNPIDLNGADRTIATNSATRGATLEENVRNTGATAALIKEGPGTLTLQGTNTYDGGTTINEGTVQFDKIVSMPASGVVTINSGTTLCVKVGGTGEWSTSGTGEGTVDGLLNGLGGQVGSTITNSGGSLCLLVTGSQTVSNVISSSGDFFVNSGTLELSGDNTFTGDVVVDGGATLILTGDNSGATGAIRIINGFLQAGVANLPGGGVIYASTGTNPALLETSGALTPTLGTGDFLWSNAGGFAATSSALTVTPNAGADIDWSANTGFNGKKLMLGSPSSTASVEIPNNIQLDADRTIRLFNNTSSSDDISILSGDIVESGTRWLFVEGTGTLSLTGNNTFGSASGRGLRISNGAVVRAVEGTGLPTTAVLDLNQGILESSGTFTRDFGTTNSQVYWRSWGGFSAHGAPLSVTLQSGGTINWNGNPVGFRGQELRFGSETSNDVVTLTNDIDMFNNRTIRVLDNPNTDADYTVFSGVIANGSGTRILEKRGTGLLVLNGVNTYTGDTRVNEGTLGGSGTIAGKLDVKGNGSLAPGASVGTLTVGGNLEIEDLANGAGLLKFELDTIAASDKITVGAALLINTDKLGLSDFAFTDLGGLENGTYVLISGATSLTGTLAADLNGTLGLATIDLQLNGNDVELVVSDLVGGSNPYNDWSTDNSLSGGTGVDEESDGLVNLLEFGFGTDPNVADNAPLNPDGSVNGTPIAQASGGGGGVTFDYVFVRRDDHGTSGSATYTVQFSGDLVTFHNSGATPTFVADSTDDADYEVVSIPYPAVLPDLQKARFARVLVEIAP